MDTMNLRETTDAEGVLNLRVPVGAATTEYEVVVVFRPLGPIPPDKRVWPPGFIEQMAGSITDETFRRYPQDEYEQRQELE